MTFHAAGADCQQLPAVLLPAVLLPAVLLPAALLPAVLPTALGMGARQLQLSAVADRVAMD